MKTIDKFFSPLRFSLTINSQLAFAGINDIDAYYGILRKDLQYILRNRPIIDFS